MKNEIWEAEGMQRENLLKVIRAHDIHYRDCHVTTGPRATPKKVSLTLGYPYTHEDSPEPCPVLEILFSRRVKRSTGRAP